MQKQLKEVEEQEMYYYQQAKQIIQQMRKNILRCMGMSLKKDASFNTISHLYSLIGTQDEILFIQYVSRCKPIRNETIIDKQLFMEILAQIDQLDVDRLFLQIKYRSLIDFTISINDISHINFTNLQNIFLSEAKISNIENIASINMPYLSSLFLYSNNIVSLRPLRKLSLKNLQSLDLTGNKFMNYQLKYLNRTNSPSLQKIILQDNQGINSQYDFKSLIKRHRGIQNRKYSQLLITKSQDLKPNFNTKTQLVFKQLFQLENW